MEDDTTSTADTTAPEAAPADEKSSDDPRITKANQEAANYRRQLREAQKELDQHRKAAQDKADADKSEAEKRAAAEQRAAEAELKATRLEVAAEKGLTPAQAKRLVGTTREELEADADEILRDFPVAPAAPPQPKTPKADPSQGSRGGAAAKNGSVLSGAELYAQKHKQKTTVT